MHGCVYVFDPNEYHMDLYNESCFFGWPAGQPSWHGITLTLEITHKLFYQVSSYLPCI